MFTVNVRSNFFLNAKKTDKGHIRVRPCRPPGGGHMPLTRMNQTLVWLGRNARKCPDATANPHTHTPPPQPTQLNTGNTTADATSVALAGHRQETGGRRGWGGKLTPLRPGPHLAHHPSTVWGRRGLEHLRDGFFGLPYDPNPKQVQERDIHSDGLD